jgi:hypothetical protein
MNVKHFQVRTFDRFSSARERHYDTRRSWQSRTSAWKSTWTWYSTTARNRTTWTGKWRSGALSDAHSQPNSDSSGHPVCSASISVRLNLMSELRVQIAPRVFRVVDFAVYRDTRPEGRYAKEPAFTVVEILSPDDRYGRLSHRHEDYRRWGVPHVWVVDPQLKRLTSTPKRACSSFLRCASPNSISNSPRRNFSKTSDRILRAARFIFPFVRAICPFPAVSSSSRGLYACRG